MVVQAIIFAAIAGALSLVAERLHARKVSRVARLAFGSSAHPRMFARLIAPLRPLAVSLGVFGSIVLVSYDPVEVETMPGKSASKHLLICMDVSPSMQIRDAGPSTDKISRSEWSGKLAQAVLDRIDMQTTRISLIAYYTDALLIFEDTFDKEVIRNSLDGLPLYAGFKPGATDMRKGVQAALELARKWPENSATLLIIGDGDSEHAIENVRIPNSIADTIVVGVGDPDRPTNINGHGSRQDSMSMRQLAARFGGYFHQGNSRHLPSEVLEKLSMLSPRVTDAWTLRELALWSVVASAAFMGLSTPLLIAFGTPHQHRARIARAPEWRSTEGTA